MRTWNRMVLVIAVLSDAGFGQGNNGPEPLDVTNVACVERMEVPRYPALATQARIEGTIKAAVLLTTAGAVEKVDIEATSKYSQAKSLFGAPVWKAMREAKFHSDCAGKTVTFVFHFSLQGTSPVQPKSAAFFGYPNTFWIVAEAMLYQPDGQVNASPAIDNRVSGRVLDPLGDPIRNQPVQLKATESFTTAAVTRTDDDGRFAFDDLSNTSYEVVFEVPGFSRLAVPVKAGGSAGTSIGTVKLMVATIEEQSQSRHMLLRCRNR